MRRVLKSAAYFVLGAASLALVVLSVLVLTGNIVEETPQAPETRRAAPEPEPEPSSPAPAPQPQPSGTPASSRPTITAVVLSAARGDCWLAVRVGDESGEVLYEGVLAQGDSLRFKQRKLWLRLGAASNLEISVDGKPADVPAGTVDLVLPAA